MPCALILLSRHLSIRPQATSHWLAVSSSRCAFNHQMRSRAASFPLICPCASLARPPSGKRSSQSLRVYPFNFYCQSLAPHFCGSLKRSAKNTVVTDVDNLLRQLSREPNGRPNLGINDKAKAEKAERKQGVALLLLLLRHKLTYTLQNKESIQVKSRSSLEVRNGWMSMYED